MKRSMWLLQATFWGTASVLAALEGGPMLLEKVTLLATCGELVLLPASYLILLNAREIQRRRFFKIALRLWAVVPLGYIAFAVAFNVLEASWRIVGGFLVAAPILIPLLSLCWLPVIFVSTFWIERWTRKEPSPF